MFVAPLPYLQLGRRDQLRWQACVSWFRIDYSEAHNELNASMMQTIFENVEYALNASGIQRHQRPGQRQSFEPRILSELYELMYRSIYAEDVTSMEEGV